MRENKPIALDICCRMGGATVGLQRAGFHVIGVDIAPQPGYPGDEFWRRDGLEILSMLTRDGYLWPTGRRIRPALIWQSWPCQDGNTATAGNRARGIVDAHEQFIPRARELSDAIGIPYVLEQPTSSRKGLIRPDITLCMDMFKGDRPPPWVQKHRSFELGNWPYAAHHKAWDASLDLPHPLHADLPEHRKHEGYVRGWRHGEYRDGPYIAAYGKGGGKGTTQEIAHAMGIDWMNGKARDADNRFDLCEAIPPAYSEWIGAAFLRGIGGYGNLGYRA